MAAILTEQIEFDGSKIKVLAKGRSLNQIALSVGISRQFMGEIVRGVSKPSIDVALRIAHVLGCSVDDLSSRKKFAKYVRYYLTDCKVIAYTSLQVS